MKKSKIVFISIFLLITIILLSTRFYDHSVKRSDGRLMPSSNKIGLGLYGKDKKVIDNGSKLNVEVGKINTKLSLSHFVDIDRDYKLIVFNNFKQVDFEANGKNGKSHNFNAKANTTVDIEVLNEVSDDTKEVDYLVIKMPNTLIEEFDPQPVLSMQQILSLRYDIENVEIPINESAPPLITTNEGPIDSVFISDSMEELNALTSASSEQDVFLSVGNTSNEVVDYALIALLDWEQVPLIDEQLVHYITVHPNEKKIFEITLPNTDEKKNYQIFAFPFPFEVSTTNYESQLVEATIRTVIKP